MDIIREELKKIAYTFYPKGICSIENNEEYLLSPQNINLKNKIKILSEDKISSEIIEELKKIDFYSKINNFTSFNFGNCYSFINEIIINYNTLIRINIEISVLVPFYYIYITENQIKDNPFKWESIPVRKKSLEIFYKKEIEIASKIIEDKTNYKKFPEELIYEIIPNTSYNDISIGSFTYYNAFFQEFKDIHNYE